jgi:hypothetical protein
MFLWGEAMSQPYDGQAAWREKFHMDDSAVQRLGRSVIRAGVSLPFILLYAFMPRPDAASTVASLAVAVLAVAGLRGLIRLRTWGVLALGAAGALVLAIASVDAASAIASGGTSGGLDGLGPWILRPVLAGGLMLSAVAPFLRPILRFVLPAVAAGRCICGFVALPCRHGQRLHRGTSGRVPCAMGLRSRDDRVSWRRRRLRAAVRRQAGEAGDAGPEEAAQGGAAPRDAGQDGRRVHRRLPG